MARDTVTVRLEADGETDEIEVPTTLVDMLGQGEDTAPEVVGDVAMMGIAQQAHGAVHHGPDDIDPDLEEAEAIAMDLFEERFDRTFAQATGHSH